MHVLLVDDEEQFLATGKVLLEKRGIDVSTCANGSDALQVVNQHPIDVVVLDIKMPGINGLDVLASIKRNHPEVEVILLSGHATFESAAKGLKLGAFDFITKPSRISEIIAKVEQAYATKRQMNEKAAQEK
jgi:DNA-binding NtrC family response regulator